MHLVLGRVLNNKSHTVNNKTWSEVILIVILSVYLFIVVVTQVISDGVGG